MLYISTVMFVPPLTRVSREQHTQRPKHVPTHPNGAPTTKTPKRKFKQKPHDNRSTHRSD